MKFLIDNNVDSTESQSILKYFIQDPTIEIEKLWVEDKKVYKWFLILGTARGVKYFEIYTDSIPYNFFDTWKGFDYPVTLKKVGSGYVFDKSDHSSSRYCSGVYKIEHMLMNEGIHMLP